MDLTLFVRGKLDFIKRFYDATSEPFLTKMRQIEAHETPFDCSDPNSEYDEPAFLEEYMEASDSVDILGNTCFCLVQSVLKQFLEAFIRETGRSLPPPSKDWFDSYRKVFYKEYGMVWESGPVRLELLEEINLARNEIQHGGDLLVKFIKRRKQYAERFPESAFTHYLPLKYMAVKRDRLFDAMDSINTFASTFNPNTSGV